MNVITQWFTDQGNFPFFPIHQINSCFWESVNWKQNQLIWTISQVTLITANPPCETWYDGREKMKSSWRQYLHRTVKCALCVYLFALFLTHLLSVFFSPWSIYIFAYFRQLGNHIITGRFETIDPRLRLDLAEYDKFPLLLSVNNYQTWNKPLSVWPLMFRSAQAYISRSDKHNKHYCCCMFEKTCPRTHLHQEETWYDVGAGLLEAFVLLKAFHHPPLRWKLTSNHLWGQGSFQSF